MATIAIFGDDPHDDGSDDRSDSRPGDPLTDPLGEPHRDHRAGPPPLGGIDLRHALLIVLDRRRPEPSTIAEMLHDLRGLGLFPAAIGAPKTVSDALRWEVKRGRVVKVHRGLYRIGHLPETTRWRALRRIERTRASYSGALRDPPKLVRDLSTEFRDLPDRRHFGPVPFSTWERIR